MSRYSRQTVLPEIGASGQARLARTRVLVVGAGGLGATLLPQLAGAGVGKIDVVDPDTVALSNLHRQTLFRMDHLDQPKAQIARDELRRLNPDVQVTPHILRADPPALRDLLQGVDVAIDAADSFATSYALSDLCLARGIPMISASVLRREGYVGGFCGTAPSLRALFPDLPDTLGSCDTAGVMGPAVAMLGALQGQMALSVLLGHTPSPLGQLMRCDLATWRVASLRFDGAPEPAAPGPAILGLSEITEAHDVYDLRDPAEAPDPAHPKAQRLLPEDLPRFRPAPGRQTVFACTSGLRAWRAVRALPEADQPAVAILAAGVA